jgi:hypothetical protein
LNFGQVAQKTRVRCFVFKSLRNEIWASAQK